MREREKDGKSKGRKDLAKQSFRIIQLVCTPDGKGEVEKTGRD